MVKVAPGTEVRKRRSCGLASLGGTSAEAQKMGTVDQMEEMREHASDLQNSCPGGAELQGEQTVRRPAWNFPSDFGASGGECTPDSLRS